VIVSKWKLLALVLLVPISLVSCSSTVSTAHERPITSSTKINLRQARAALLDNRDRVRAALTKEASFSGTPTSNTLSSLDDAEGALAQESTALLNQFDSATGNDDSRLVNAIQTWSSNTIGPFKTDLNTCGQACLKGASRILLAQEAKLDRMIDAEATLLGGAAYRTDQTVDPARVAAAAAWGVSGHSATSIAPSTAGAAWSSGNGNDIQIITMEDVVDAISRAKTVTATAFTLSRRSDFAHALEADHARGAAVTVELDSDAFGGARRSNEITAAAFRAEGIGIIYSQGPLHAKVAMIDHQLVMSDRNWDNDGGFIILDRSKDDRNVIAALLRGHPSSNSHFWTVKGDALVAESHVIGNDRGASVDFESESFGGNNVVYDALMARARGGAHVRVIVAAQEYDSTPSEREAILELKTAGVAVRIGSTNEKLGLTGSTSFFSSANATAGLPDQIDWGMTTTDRGLMSQLSARYQRNWDQASPV